MVTTPSYHEHEDFRLRKEKLQDIRQAGVEPYPHRYPTPDSLSDLFVQSQEQEVGNSEQAQCGETPSCRVAGRLVLFRAMGKNAFAHIQSGSTRIQVMFNRDHTVVEGYHPTEEQALTPHKFIEKKFDLGDILGIEGHLFRTQKGELTIYAKNVTLLCKSLLPLPDKHSGLSDKETRYRKRWLDLIASPDVYDTFLLRSRIVKIIRDYCHHFHFLEVETPILQSIYGGAEAKPFVTNLHALDQEMFLRISLEISLKKLLVGGIERVFEMGRCFRNEGIDRNHNPEFTLLEAYATYWDYNDMMIFVENLYEKIALDLFGKPEVSLTTSEGETMIIDLRTPWKKMTMEESLVQYTDFDPRTMSDNEMRQRLKASEHVDLTELARLNRGLLIQTLFEVEVEPHLIQPHHIIDYPIETTPLCKPHREKNLREKGIVERFESYILGQEICNAYSELNDPEIQRDLLELQAKRREMGDEEASPFDEDFIEAICQGLPPVAGVGIGIDRLVMLFSQAHSIRDVLFFPWMKPL